MQKALIRLRFIVKENAPKKIKKDFEKTNNDLNKLTNILVQLDNKNLEFMLSNSLFIPLELISENENNVNFIHNILGLTHMNIIQIIFMMHI